ncbi:hypothetical protein RFI_02337 [Reticulomyxa filosa]|uniref:F-box domain-containing protein n=1 Tax=Reticulomyxa filosa TaxID=46433 RepID=X6PAT2_RETFI|nr:hypothetical protein RFI_02337 [Reticulomyxa filosa]|eukprot:ETO34752.1 hypothetical protein RFI_02337 [Reticulomyxa filosa]
MQPRTDENEVSATFPFHELPLVLLEYILNLSSSENHLHRLRLVCKEWNQVCDQCQLLLECNERIPIPKIQFWFDKLSPHRLQHVILSHTKVDDDFVQWLADHKNLSKLQSLNLDYCWQLTSASKPYMEKIQSKKLELHMQGMFMWLEPNVHLSAEGVVLLQLYAMKCNQIEHCFKFASPENKRSTGPLQRFARMIRTFYACMINWEEVTTKNITPNPVSRNADAQSTNDEDEAKTASDDDDDDSDDTVEKEDIQQIYVCIAKAGRRAKFIWVVRRQPYFKTSDDLLNDQFENTEEYKVCTYSHYLFLFCQSFFF